MNEPRPIGTFSEFWPEYLNEHSRPATRVLHLTGSALGAAFLVSALARRRPVDLLYGLAAGYGLAWIGHFFIEKNRPATFRHPLWSFMGDGKMFGLAVRGRLGEELERVGTVGPTRSS